MCQLVSRILVSALVCGVPIGAVAQTPPDPSPPTPSSPEPASPAPATGSPASGAATLPAPAPPVASRSPARDEERPGPPQAPGWWHAAHPRHHGEHGHGHGPPPDGTRLWFRLQSSTPMGELVSRPAPDADDGRFDFGRATLAGVPDAIVGVRLGSRFGVGLGFSWLSISEPAIDFNLCSGREEPFDRTWTLLGVLPTVRADVLRAAHGRARLEVGLTVPLVLMPRSLEVPTTASCMTRPSGRDVREATDGLYGVDLHVGARYHPWPAIALGAEIGASQLWFDADENRDTRYEEPTVSTLTTYSALTLDVELPL
ncbi:MAG: hypothetical protein NZ898_17000 [Myxococcota bacterium]|nr:hypothetical protein [Myxococcota bacterium]MDW8362357.1 hypothetical protein [Myxococcales bacterium]